MTGGGPLVDTSVLIDYFGGADNREARILDGLLTAGPPPATAPIIVQEYLQGLLNNRQFELARSVLDDFDQIGPPGYAEHVHAAQAHLRARRRGVTVPTVDTLIVTMALLAGRGLLTRDQRQKGIARQLGVALA